MISFIYVKGYMLESNNEIFLYPPSRRLDNKDEIYYNLMDVLINQKKAVL